MYRLIAVLAFLVVVSDGSVRAADGGIAPAAAAARIKAGSLALIDVRSPREWRATGVAARARAITIHDPEGGAGFVRRVLTAFSGDKTAPIALICARGHRSARARKLLVAAGFSNVHDISEGMLGRGAAAPGWIGRGLPVTPCTQC